MGSGTGRGKRRQLEQLAFRYLLIRRVRSPERDGNREAQGGTSEVDRLHVRGDLRSFDPLDSGSGEARWRRRDARERGYGGGRVRGARRRGRTTAGGGDDQRAESGDDQPPRTVHGRVSLHRSSTLRTTLPNFPGVAKNLYASSASRRLNVLASGTLSS